MPAKLRLHAAPATLVSLAVILAFGGVALVSFTSASTWSRTSGGRRSASAASKQPKCGDTITTDTKLHKDLVNCPNNGIIIGADNVTLDLNGHEIDGDGTPTAGCDPQTDFCDVGVANFGHDGVTVMHGSLRQFGGGVNFGGIRSNRLLGVSTSRNADVGIQFFGSSRILIRNCSGNRTTSRQQGTGIGVFDSRHLRIVNSTFRHNPHVGIKPVRTTNGVVKGNLVSHSGDEGFSMEGGEGFHVKGNRLVRNRAGIVLVPGSNNVIIRNRVLRGVAGIKIAKGHGNLVAHNRVAHTRRAGIRLGIKHPFIAGAHNVLRRNRVNDSGVDGFVVLKKERHSLLKLNVARRATGDGFHIDSRSTTLTRNRAVDNGDLGIDAVFSVIDGGGNRARGNGDPRQCVNIVCN
jgi:parallel beta-helix repeat protein